MELSMSFPPPPPLQPIPPCSPSKEPLHESQAYCHCNVCPCPILSDRRKHLFQLPLHSPPSPHPSMSIHFTMQVFKGTNCKVDVISEPFPASCPHRVYPSVNPGPLLHHTIILSAIVIHSHAHPFLRCEANSANYAPPPPHRPEQTLVRGRGDQWQLRHLRARGGHRHRPHSRRQHTTKLRPVHTCHIVSTILFLPR